MIHIAALAAIALVSQASVLPAQMSRDVVDALRPATVEGKVVQPIVAELRKYVPEIPRACDKANKLRVVYRGTDAFVSVLINDTECFAVVGPANGLRFMLFQFRGEPT